MICYADKTFCLRSNKDWCDEVNCTPCNNISCHRHCWEIPKDNKLPICQRDFGEECKAYFNAIEALPCPFCGSKEFKITPRAVDTYYNFKTDKAFANYCLKIRCKCGLVFDGIIAKNLEVGNKEELALAKMASIYKWNQRYENKE